MGQELDHWLLSLLSLAGAGLERGPAPNCSNAVPVVAALACQVLLHGVPRVAGDETRQDDPR